MATEAQKKAKTVNQKVFVRYYIYSTSRYASVMLAFPGRGNRKTFFDQAHARIAKALGHKDTSGFYIDCFDWQPPD